MDYTAKKLFNGFVSVRDYLVKRCIKEQESLTIWYNCENKTYTPLQLSKAFQLHSKEFKSKFNGKPYKLVDFKWYEKSTKNTTKQSRQTLPTVKRPENSMRTLWEE